MPDLPDWYSAVEASLTKAINLTSGLDAAKAASPTVGDVYVATDTTIVYVCYAAGTWTNIGALYLLLAGGTMSGAIAMGSSKITGLAAASANGDAVRYQQPVMKSLLTAQGDIIVRGASVPERFAKPTTGQYLKATATGYEGGTVGELVSGLIVMWHGTIANIPSGFVICDGNNSTPNLLAKFVQGVATAATNPGAVGGEATHALTTAELASHSHGLPIYSSTHSSTQGTVSVQGLGNGVTGAVPATAASGSGDAHENKPPFYDVAFLMKT